MTFALRRRFPDPWLIELRAALDDFHLRYEATGFDGVALDGSPVELTVTADEEQAKQLKQWCATHGDDVLDVFGARRHRFNLPKKKHVLKAGDSLTLPLQQLTGELTGGFVLPSTLEQRGQMVTFDVEADRLIPNSGWLGRMGRFRAAVSVDGVDGISEDHPGIDFLPSTYAHYDPACERFAIGSPGFGALYVKTATTTARVTLAATPTHIRRWRRWVET